MNQTKKTFSLLATLVSLSSYQALAFPSDFAGTLELYKTGALPSNTQVTGTWKLVGLAINPAFAADELGCDGTTPDCKLVEYDASGLQTNGTQLALTFSVSGSTLSCQMSDLINPTEFNDAMTTSVADGALNLAMKGEDGANELKQCRLSGALLVCGTGLDGMTAVEGKVISFEAYARN